jgi:hypothetical protein
VNRSGSRKETEGQKGKAAMGVGHERLESSALTRTGSNPVRRERRYVVRIRHEQTYRELIPTFSREREGWRRP